MTYSCIERLEGTLYAAKGYNTTVNATGLSSYGGRAGSVTTAASLLKPTSVMNNRFLSSNDVEAKIMISMTLTFISGIIQVNDTFG